MSVIASLLLPEAKDLLKDPVGNHHPLIQQSSLKLVAWTISRNTYRQREFQKGLQILSPTTSTQDHLSITNRLEANGLAGVEDGNCASLDVMKVMF